MNGWMDDRWMDGVACLFPTEPGMYEIVFHYGIVSKRVYDFFYCQLSRLTIVQGFLLVGDTPNCGVSLNSCQGQAGGK